MQIKFKFSKPNTKLHKAKVHINADFYWQIIIVFSLFVVVLGAVFGFYLFSQINKEFTIFDTNDGQTIESVKKERLDKALQYFETREVNSKNILNNPAPIVDPSR